MGTNPRQVYLKESWPFKSWDLKIVVFVLEVLQSLVKSSKSAQRYCISENGVFRAPQQNHFHGCTTVHTKYLLLLISAIAPRRFGDFANQLGGIAWICKSSDFASEVLRFQNSCFRGALKTRLSKMQYLWDEMLDISCFCNTSYTIWTILTCQALRRGPFPPPKW